MLLARLSFPQGLERDFRQASVDTPDFSALKPSSDRVGWLTAGNEYIEFALDGRENVEVGGTR